MLQELGGAGTRPVIGRMEADQIKGLAILLMMAHHLFGLPTLIAPENAYWPILPGVPLEYGIGRFGKVCVCLFLFVSGYGFALKSLQPGAAAGGRYYADKMLRFFGTYAFYFVVIVTIGALFFQRPLAGGEMRYPVTPMPFVLGLLMLQYDFAYEWWFAQTYVLLVALTAPLLAAARRPLLLLLASGGAFVVGAAMDVAGVGIPLISISNLLIWQLPFTFGLLAARTGLIDPLLRPGAGLSAAVAVVLFAGVFAVERFAPKAMTPYLIVTTPMSVSLAAGAARALGARRPGTALAILGRLSLPLWLVHPFLCYYFAQAIIFAPRWSPLVFLNLLTLSFIAVWTLEQLRRTLVRMIDRLRPAPVSGETVNRN